MVINSTREVAAIDISAVKCLDIVNNFLKTSPAYYIGTKQIYINRNPVIVPDSEISSPP